MVRKLRLVMFLGLIGGPIVVGVGYYQYLEAVKLREKGKTTEGTIVESSTLATGKGRSSYRLVVDYGGMDGFSKRYVEKDVEVEAGKVVDVELIEEIPVP